MEYLLIEISLLKFVFVTARLQTVERHMTSIMTKLFCELEANQLIATH